MFEFLQAHATALGMFAPWVFFAMLLLAGLNIPFSADLIILCASLCSAAMPHQTIIFFSSVLIGCILSSWIAFFLGRFLGPKLKTTRWLSRFLPEKRLEKIRHFYSRHGFLTLLVGRFIPFGVRNAIFMSAGMSKVPFTQFAMRDGIACTIWCSLSFTTFYILSGNLDALRHNLKMIQIVIFGAFALSVIAVIWYKKRKKKRSSTQEI